MAVPQLKKTPTLNTNHEVREVRCPWSFYFIRLWFYLYVNLVGIKANKEHFIHKQHNANKYTDKVS